MSTNNAGTTTSVVITRQGVPQFVRIIPTGGDDLTTALSTRLGIPMENADALKRSTGLAASVKVQCHSMVCDPGSGASHAA